MNCKVGCRLYWSIITLCVLLINSSCNNDVNDINGPLFELRDSSVTGINFVNALSFRNDFNIYRYRNYYNGGGVAIGDVNNDGLQDIYLTANMEPNQLYINKGNLQFDEVGMTARVQGERAWSTGVSMVDINADGLIDIYVCNSGDVKGDNKKNELFINKGSENGVPQFSEEAEKYGLANEGFSTHAAFFDYDKDGDLDVYLLNNSYRAIGSFNLKLNERPKRDEKGGDKLLRNDDGQFTDVSAEAGIYGSVIGFGLGVTVGDVDNDGWQDIFISNDFFERDYLYINNQDGTFSERLTEQMQAISAASMGADMADIDNDLHPDIFVTEMLPGTYQRLKTKTTFENWDKYQYNLENDYYHQFTRNMLHYNNGNGSYSEVSRFAGVEATDWSWGALIADFDNDGWKDLFVANGIYQDLTDQDYLNYIADEEVMKSIITEEGVDYQRLVDVIPSNPIANYVYRNNKRKGFDNVTKEWGLDVPTFSNGSAYADLDNDGDLDLVINNVNMPLYLYENQSAASNYVKLLLEGGKSNPNAIGAKTYVHACGEVQYLEQLPNTGFQSSMDNRPNFGLGNCKQIDSIVVIWPDLTKQVVPAPSINVTHKLTKATSQLWDKRIPSETAFELADISLTDHQENLYSDFNRDRMLYQMMSTEGPAMSVGDVNKDGRIDIYIGGARDQAGSILLQLEDGNYEQSPQSAFTVDKAGEDINSVFFDADGDDDLDLYVCRGGNEFSNMDNNLKDVLYFNDQGVFRKSDQSLPTTRFESTSTVDAGDFDGDGDLDLFVGVRLEASYYGVPLNGYILQNDGNGFFQNVTATYAPALTGLGMIRDAQWVDIDNDDDLDLVVAGEWMSIKMFINDGTGRLSEQSQDWKIDGQKGLFNTFHIADLDGNGYPDLVIGNHGLNSRLQGSSEHPMQMIVGDFDKNSSVEQIYATYEDGDTYPVALRHDLISQLPGLKKEFVTYEAYAEKTLLDIFNTERMERALTHEATELSSFIAYSNGSEFEIEVLPEEIQWSSIYAIESNDVNGDGKLDLILGGNLYGVRPEMGRYDASYGDVLLQGDHNSWEVMEHAKSGLSIKGEVRQMKLINSEQGEVLVVARNNDKALVYSKK